MRNPFVPRKATRSALQRFYARGNRPLIIDARDRTDAYNQVIRRAQRQEREAERISVVSDAATYVIDPATHILTRVR